MKQVTNMASKESKRYTSCFRRYGFTKLKWPLFHSDSEKKQFNSISTFFGNLSSNSNNNNQRGDKRRNTDFQSKKKKILTMLCFIFFQNHL